MCPSRKTDFVSYQKGGFDGKQHQALFASIRDIAQKGCFVLIAGMYQDLTLGLICTLMLVYDGYWAVKYKLVQKAGDAGADGANEKPSFTPT